MTDEVWTEVLNENVMVTWAWNGYALGAFVLPIGDDVRIDSDTVNAIDRYSEDKELNLTVERLYDESDYDGTVKEYVREVLAA